MNVRTTCIFIALAMITTTRTLPAQATGDSDAPAATALQGPEFVPMTRSERLRDYLSGTFGPGALAGAALHADVSQLRHTPREWGRDPAGMGQRVGNVFAQHVIRKSLESGGAGILHEDNRYLASGQKGFWKRTRYAVASSFLARHDNGRRGLSLSRIGSAAGTVLISRSWLPGSAVTAAAGASSFGATIGFGVGTNVIREFWPDIKRRFGRH